MAVPERWSRVAAMSGKDWVLREEAEAEVERLREAACKCSTKPDLRKMDEDDPRTN